MGRRPQDVPEIPIGIVRLGQVEQAVAALPNTTPLGSILRAVAHGLKEQGRRFHYAALILLAVKAEHKEYPFDEGRITTDMITPVPSSEVGQEPR